MSQHHHHHHHHHHRHDVFDDTHHNQQFDPSNEITIHRHESDSSTRHHPRSTHHHNQHHESHAVIEHPFQDMDSMCRAAERDMDRAFGGGFGTGFGGGMFGSMRNMMTSMDRMFDQVRANATPGSGGTYYYESRKMTVGPDGRVHEETVRTAPDEHGNPQTSRTVRDGDRVQEMGPSRTRTRRGRSSRQDDEVVIEELDEHGEPIRENRVERRRSSRDDREARGRRVTQTRSTGNWLRDRYNKWRSRA